MCIKAEKYPVPSCVGLTHKSSTAGLASVSKNILGLETHGRFHSLPGIVKKRCTLLCHAHCPLADDCIKSLKTSPEKADGGVFSQPACRGCQVWGSSKRAGWVPVSHGDAEEGGLLRLCTVCTVSRGSPHPSSVRSELRILQASKPSSQHCCSFSP